MQSWQDRAWQKWLDAEGQGLPPEVSRGLNALGRKERLWWLWRWRKGPSPVARGMARWLRDALDSLFWVVPGDAWDRLEWEEGTLLAYPEPLGWDPLAMASLGPLWAQDHRERMARVVEVLGAATVPALWAGQYESPWGGLLWSSYRKCYGIFSEEMAMDVMAPWFKGPDDASGFDGQWPWPEMPADVGEYRAQLEYGLVPHDPYGKSPKNPVAVLVAFHQTDAQRRESLAGLTYKALEGGWLIKQWERQGEPDGHR